MKNSSLRKISAEAEKAGLTKQLNDLIDEMDKTTEDINTKQEEIGRERDRTDPGLRLMRIISTRVRRSIKYMYENANTQFIEVLLESKSIGEFPEQCRIHWVQISDL